MKLRAEVDHHNRLLNAEYAQGEEGIDYVHLKPGQSAPDVLNEKKLEREIRAELKELKLREPLLAERLEKGMFSKNTPLDKELAETIPED